MGLAAYLCGAGSCCTTRDCIAIQVRSKVRRVGSGISWWRCRKCIRPMIFDGRDKPRDITCDMTVGFKYKMM